MTHLLHIWHVLKQFTIMFPCRPFILYQYSSHSGLLTHVLRVFIIISFSSPFDDSFSVFFTLSLLTVLPMSNSFLFGTEVDWFDINNLIHSFWFSQGDFRHMLHTYSPFVLHFWPVLGVPLVPLGFFPISPLLVDISLHLAFEYAVVTRTDSDNCQYSLSTGHNNFILA